MYPWWKLRSIQRALLLVFLLCLVSVLHLFLSENDRILHTKQIVTQENSEMVIKFDTSDPIIDQSNYDASPKARNPVSPQCVTSLDPDQNSARIWHEVRCKDSEDLKLSTINVYAWKEKYAQSSSIFADRLEEFKKAGETVDIPIHIDVISSDSRDEYSYHLGLLIGNRIEFSERHGYNFYFFSKAFTEVKDLAANFGKIASIQHAFNSKLGEKQWIAWVDNDIIFTNPELNFESIIRQYGHDQTDLIITRDLIYTSFPINNGIFLIRNTAWSRRLIHDLLTSAESKKQSSRQYGQKDQDAMTHILQAQKDMGSEIDGSIRIHRHVSVIPTRVMNSFCRPYLFYQKMDAPHVETGIWHPGDLVAHFTGSGDSEERYSAMVSLLQAVIRQPRHPGESNPCLRYPVKKK